MYRRTLTLLTLTLLIGATYLGIRYVQQQTRADRALKQLDLVTLDYERLRETYNQAIARTAVTELLVKDGALAVVVRNAQGELKRIETPYDPAGEIYVDYIVLDNRLWIRRVFDHNTTPREGIVIDPELANLDWAADHVHHGKAVYRSLTEGRWLITVTGDGALGLEKTNKPASYLAPPPPIHQYDEVDS